MPQLTFSGARSGCFSPQPIGRVFKGILPGSRASCASFPVWGDSTSDRIEFRPLPKKKALKLYHYARQFERQTRTKGRQDGRLGRNGLKVLETLIFDFLNYRTGELFPSIPSIAAKAGIGLSSVRRGLDKLKAAGVLHWQRRKDSVLALGRVLWFQLSNAYRINPADGWVGFRVPDTDMPPPHPTVWGATPALPNGLMRAVQLIAEREATAPNLFSALEEDPTDGLAMALARLGKAMSYGRPS